MLITIIKGHNNKINYSVLQISYFDTIKVIMNNLKIETKLKFSCY